MFSFKKDKDKEEGEKSLIGEFMGGGGEGTQSVAGGIDAGMGVLSAGMAGVKDIMKGKGERMDEKGAVTHDVNALGKITSMASAGAKFGPWGAGAGALAGGVLAGIDALKQPDRQDSINQRNRFDMGLQIGAITNSDTQPVQARAAEDGVNKVKGDETIEVERDEIVLRKVGNAYKKVADFTGAKTHAEGGQDYKAQKGDIIHPGKNRLAINKALRTRDWKRIGSMTQMLPPEPVAGKAKEGIKEVKGKVKAGKWSVEAMKAIREVYPDINDSAAQSLLANIAHESSKGAYSAEIPLRWKNIEGSSDLKTIKKKVTAYMEKNNLTKAQYDALPGPDRLSIQYQGDVGHELAGGIGALQTTDVSGSKIDTMRKVGKDLGAEDAKGIRKYVSQGTYEATLYSLKVMEAEGITTDKLNSTKGALDMRKQFINPGESSASKLKKVANYEKEIATNYKQIQESSGVGAATTRENQEPAAQNQAQETTQNTQGATQKPEEYTDEERFWDNQKLVRHRGTAKGRSAAALNEKQRRNIDDSWNPNDDPENATMADWIHHGASWLTKGAVQGFTLGGQKVQDFITGEDTADKHNELQFEEGEEADALRKEYQDIIFETIDDEEILSLAGLTDTANFVTKFTSNLLTGQGTSGTDLYRGANLLSMYDDKTVESIRQKLVDKGISQEGMYLFEDMARSPQNYYSSNIEGAEAIDVMTMLVNPKSAVTGAAKTIKKAPSALKAGGRLAMKGAEKGAQGAKWTKNKVKKVYDQLKTMDLKKLPKQAWEGLDRMLQEAPMYAKGEGMMDILDKAQDLAKKSGTPEGDKLVTKVKGYKELWNDLGSYAKGKANSLSKIIQGSTLDELKSFKQDIKNTTGLDWKDAKKLSKTELANATKKQMRGLQDNLAKANKEMRAHQQDYLAKKKELLAKVDADGMAYAENHPEVVALQADMDKIAGKMDALNIQGEKLRKQVPLAFDEDFNIIEGTQIIKDGKVVDRTEQLGETYRQVTKIMDDSNDAWQRTDELRKIKTAEKLAEFEKNTIGGVNKAGAELKKQSNRGLRPLVANKVKALDDIEDLEQLRKRFPNAYNKLQQADRLKSLPKDAVGLRTALAQIANEEPEMGLDGKYDQNRPVDAQAQGVILQKGPEGEVDPSLIQEGAGEGAEGDEGGKGDAEVDAGKTDPNTGKDTDSPRIGQRISGGLSQLAGYAPAIYNIVKGMQKPDKVQRRFVTPQTKKFQPMAQPQLNAIENAFQTSMSNARNLSGGMAANFRSNTEKAWADKIARTGQVNASEAQRADQVASQNIDIRNRADQYNTQANARYDEIDMRSEAATNSFLGQGIQDVANIGSRNKRDRMAQSNQDKMLGMMGTGNYKYNANTGEVTFVGGNKSSAQEPQAREEVKPVIGQQAGVEMPSLPDAELVTPDPYKQ